MKNLIHLSQLIAIFVFSNPANADSFYRFATFRCNNKGFELKSIGTYEGGDKVPGSSSKDVTAYSMFSKLKSAIKIGDGEYTFFALEPNKLSNVDLVCKVENTVWNLQFQLYPPAASGQCGAEPHAGFKLKKNGKDVIRNHSFAACESATQSIDEFSLQNDEVKIKCRGEIDSLVTPPIDEFRHVKCSGS